MSDFRNVFNWLNWVNRKTETWHRLVQQPAKTGNLSNLERLIRPAWRGRRVGLRSETSTEPEGGQRDLMRLNVFSQEEERMNPDKKE